MYKRTSPECHQRTHCLPPPFQHPGKLLTTVIFFTSQDWTRKEIVPSADEKTHRHPTTTGSAAAAAVCVQAILESVFAGTFVTVLT